MGMYTKIRHPATGAEIQIKTGYDDCLWYSVGDKVYWTPREAWPGDHIDGAYSGFMDKSGDVWVVIKDCTVLAVHDAEDLDNEAICMETHLCGLYGIEPPDSTLWSDEAWERHRERQEAHKKRWEAIEKEADDKGLSGNARLAFMMIQPLLVRRDLASLGREVFTVEPLS